MVFCREMNPDGSYTPDLSFAPSGLPGWDARSNEAVPDPAFSGTFRIAATQADGSTNALGTA